MRLAWWTARLCGSGVPDLDRVLAVAAGRDSVDQDPEEQLSGARRILASFAHLPEV